VGLGPPNKALDILEGRASPTLHSFMLLRSLSGTLWM